MLKKIVFYILISFYSLIAQDNIKISGIISNAHSGSVLPYTNIKVKDKNFGTTTNKEGQFELRLPRNKYELIISYIGFETVTKKIDSSIDNLQIRLKPIEIEFDVVEVSAKQDQTWEEWFISNAIKVKNEQKEKINHFETNSYAKSVFSVFDNDSSKIIALIESVSEVNYIKPDYYSEKILSVKKPITFKNMPNELLAVNKSVNLYNEDIKINVFSILSPLADNSLSKYNYIAQKEDIFNNERVIKIKVSPKKDSELLFKGIMTFNKNSFQLLEAELSGNEAVKDGVCDSVKILQKYSQTEKHCNLPTFTKFSFNMNYFGMNIKFVQEYTYTNYIINSSSFDGQIVLRKNISYEPNINFDVDKVRGNLFNVPLTQEEIKHQQFIKEKIENGSLFLKIYLFVFSDLLCVVTDEPVELGGHKIHRFSNWYNFNKVQGHYIGAEYQLLNTFNENLLIKAGYSFGGKTGHYGLLGRYKNLYFDVNDEVKNLGDFGYSKVVNSISALFSHEDDYDYYHSRNAKVNLDINLSNKFYSSFGLFYENKKPLKNSTNFSFFNTGKNFKENYQIKDYTTSGITLELGYIENKDELDGEIIPYLGDSFINASLVFKYAPENLLNNTEKRVSVDFTTDTRISIYEPFALRLISNLHLENETSFDQELNFIHSLDMIENSESTLATYTLDNLKYTVGDNLSIRGNLNLFNLPSVLGFRPSVGLTGMLIRPLNNIQVNEFETFSRNFYEYGISLKGVSIFNFNFIRNNFNSNWHFKMTFYYDF